MSNDISGKPESPITEGDLLHVINSREKLETAPDGFLGGKQKNGHGSRPRVNTSLVVAGNAQKEAGHELELMIRLVWILKRPR